eukprot:scaffold521_cov308-Prasinococcus_capsulatus_cf.AAC.10
MNSHAQRPRSEGSRLQSYQSGSNAPSPASPCALSHRCSTCAAHMELRCSSAATLARDQAPSATQARTSLDAERSMLAPFTDVGAGAEPTTKRCCSAAANRRHQSAPRTPEHATVAAALAVGARRTGL